MPSHDTARPNPFCCPICSAPLSRAENALRCSSGHSFDIARQGYVNLLLKKPDNLYEDKALFTARRAVYEAGFFDPVVRAIDGVLGEGAFLDAGCGEGSLLSRLHRAGREGIGLDIAKPAVQIAAAHDKQASWCVGDLCHIPLPDQSVHTIVNMLTPANYAEFTRVLAPGGTLVKIIPNAGHLQEIRAHTGAGPYRHDPADAQSLLEKTFTLLEKQAIHYTFDADAETAAHIFAMTPLTAHRMATAAPPRQVTVDVTLLRAAKKD